MNITVNGKGAECPDGASLSDLLRQLGLSPDRIVVERNGEIVPAEAFASTVLGEGDTLELLQFVGGGCCPAPSRRSVRGRGSAVSPALSVADVAPHEGGFPS